MNIQKELSSLEYDIKMLKLRIDNLKLHLKNLEQEISLYKNKKSSIKENLKTLKERGITPKLLEYKIIKSEFKTVSSQISILQLEFENHLILFKHAEKLLLDKSNHYDILLKDQYAKVLKGNFNAKKRNA